MLYALYIIAIIVLIATDQFSKFLIVQNIKLSESIELVKGFFNITHVRNYGAGFSIMQNQRFFLTAITIIALIIFTYLLLKSKNNEVLDRVCYLLIIGGALGNLFDRITLGYVIDFLDFYIFGYDFPVFNLADSFLTIGFFILAISIILEGKNAKN